LVDSGVCERSVVQREWPVTLPEEVEVWRSQNRMLEFVDLNADFDAVATALQRFRPCLIGVRWPGGGGHAIMATQLVRDGSRGWALRGPNSWKESWGDKPGYTADELQWLKVNNRRPLTGGWWTLTERQCADFGSYGCWAAGSSV
jgi:hypothetical protein